MQSDQIGYNVKIIQKYISLPQKLLYIMEKKIKNSGSIHSSSSQTEINNCIFSFH